MDQDIWAVVLEAWRQKEIRPRELAAAMGISYMRVWRLLNGKTEVSLRDAQAAYAALGRIRRARLEAAPTPEAVQVRRVRRSAFAEASADEGAGAAEYAGLERLAGE